MTFERAWKPRADPSGQACQPRCRCYAPPLLPPPENTSPSNMIIYAYPSAPPHLQGQATHVGHIEDRGVGAAVDGGVHDAAGRGDECRAGGRRMKANDGGVPCVRGRGQRCTGSDATSTATCRLSSPSTVLRNWPRWLLLVAENRCPMLAAPHASLPNTALTLRSTLLPRPAPPHDHPFLSR